MNIIHRKSSTTEYRSWSEMKRRCKSKERDKYNSWALKGVVVCERWLEFQKSYDDMGPKPSKDHQIERIDNDGNYEPGNCRWATRKEQCNNRRNSHFLTLGTKTQTIQQWCDQLGIPDTTLHNRLKRGWSAERSLTN